jgi:transposase InsO family protein
LDDKYTPIQSIFGCLNANVITAEQLATATEADELMHDVIKYVIDGWPSSRQSVPAAVRLFFDRQTELSVAYHGRCLLRDQRVVVPASLQHAILELAHEGHPGIVRMKQRCRESVWWPGIDNDIERYVRQCSACILSGKSVRPTPGPLQPVPLPAGPWRKLSLDIAGEFVAAPANRKYLIVAVDYYSRWPEVAACGSPTTDTVIEFLTALFDRYGLVDEICTDNGVQFTSAAFADFLRAHDIKHIRSALYAPQTQGEVERVNRVLKEGIRAAMAEGKTFLCGLRQTLAAYRTLPHSTTGCSPASLMLSFPVRTPLNKLSAAVAAAANRPNQTPPRPASSTLSPPAVAPPSTATASVERRVRFAQQLMKDRHDRRVHAKQTRIAAGDSIRVRLPSPGHKLAPVYSDPVQVTRSQGNTVWTADGKRWNVRRCIRVQSAMRRRNIENNTSVVPDAPASHPDDADTTAPTGEPIACSSDLDTNGFAPAPSDVRRSSRARRSTDFGPFVLFD